MPLGRRAQTATSPAASLICLWGRGFGFIHGGGGGWNLDGSV
jgi:hypothetical protein